MTFFKLFLLVAGLYYLIINLGNFIRNNDVQSKDILYMLIYIVSFVYLEFDFLK